MKFYLQMPASDPVPVATAWRKMTIYDQLYNLDRIVDEYGGECRREVFAIVMRLVAESIKNLSDLVGMKSDYPVRMVMGTMGRDKDFRVTEELVTSARAALAELKEAMDVYESFVEDIANQERAANREQAFRVLSGRVTVDPVVLRVHEVNTEASLSKELLWHSDSCLRNKQEGRFIADCHEFVCRVRLALVLEGGTVGCAATAATHHLQALQEIGLLKYAVHEDSPFVREFHRFKDALLAAFS